MKRDPEKVRHPLRLAGLLAALWFGLAACAPPTPNGAPTDIVLDSASIDENLPAASLVGTLSTTDPDAGDSHSYALVAGAGDDDNASFAIDGDELQTAAPLDFETAASYSVRVRTDDGKGGTFARSFAITVNDIPEVTELSGDVSGLRVDMGIALREPGAHLMRKGSEALNQLILESAHRRGATLGPAPIRGLNAAWLDLLQQQQPNVLLAGQIVVAIGDDGEVLGQGTIAPDGTFSLSVPQDRRFALYQARDDGSLLCNRSMGYMDLDSGGKTIHWRTAYFSIDSSGSSGAPPAQLDVGSFAFSEHNASLGGGWSQDPMGVRSNRPSGDLASCGNVAQVRAPVDAVFDLALPDGVGAGSIFDFGLAIALSYDTAGVPTFLGSAVVGADGTVGPLSIGKLAGGTQEVTLILTDAGVFSDSKLDYPLTPSAMVGGGPAAVTTQLGDGGHDFGSVSGGLARLVGTVYVNGEATGGAEVLAVLDSSSTLATNIAVSNPDGSFELLLPVDDDEGYTIVATDPVTGLSESPCYPTCMFTTVGDELFDIWIFDPTQGVQGAD